MRRKRHLVRRLAAASIALALVGVVPAAAHPVLVSSEPRQDARVVEPPEVVVLEFSEPVSVIEMTVISPEGEDVAQGSAPEEPDRTLRQAVGLLPEQGAYTVRYQVMSQDDHTVTGEITFDYAGPITEADDEPADDGPEDPPAQADASDASADERPLVLRLWPLLLLAVVAAAGIAVAARAFRSTRADDR